MANGPARPERHLLVKRARMQGFAIFDHMDLDEPRSPSLLIGCAQADCDIVKTFSTA